MTRRFAVPEGPAYDHQGSVDAVRGYFDLLGDDEWERLRIDVAGRVSHEVHRRFLHEHLSPGMRVLEIGAGPGTFTGEIVTLGCRVVATDVSPRQLELNVRHVGEAALEEGVESRDVVDICDLSRYENAEFDAVVAFGGPLSYAFDQAEHALREMLRVTRPTGPVLASVMSTLGAYRRFIGGVAEIIDLCGEDAVDRVLDTGDLRESQPPGSGQHTCRMFTHQQIVELVRRAGGRVLAASASNWASLGDPEVLEGFSRAPDRWERFVEREVRVCREPGVLDGGTHLLVSLVRLSQMA